jgi:uncharacterized membrane protein (DUF485 family)
MNNTRIIEEGKFKALLKRRQDLNTKSIINLFIFVTVTILLLWFTPCPDNREERERNGLILIFCFILLISWHTWMQNKNYLSYYGY